MTNLHEHLCPLCNHACECWDKCEDRSALRYCHMCSHRLDRCGIWEPDLDTVDGMFDMLFPEHEHRCSSCPGGDMCRDPECKLEDTYYRGSARLCAACSSEEFDRFAAFVGAIRDVLRWLRIASNLRLMASGLRDSVGDVLGEYGCSCECTLYGMEREHNDDCDGNCTPCEGCAVQRVLNEYYESERRLQREGELLENGEAR